MTHTFDSVRADALDRTSLHLIVMPTEKCNFRCTYCYEDFAIGRMSQGVANGLKRWIERRISGLEHLHVAWFGGEPMLATQRIVEINSFIQSRRHQTLDFHSSISTNGWLLDSGLLKSLCAVGVKLYQISLDGDAMAHDQTRRLRSGGRTYDRIMCNLESAAESDNDFRIVIRVHVHRDNVASVGRLIQHLCKRFSGDRRFGCYAKAVAALGDEYYGPTLLRDKRIVADLNRALESCGMFARESSPHACYAAHANSFVIRSDGRLGKCTVALSDPANTIGAICEDGTVRIDYERIVPWIRGVFSGDGNALRCPLIGIGSVGVAARHDQQSHSISQPSPVHNG